MKRNYNTRYNTNDKINTDYISANKIKNHLMNDPLLDYLKEYQINNNDDPDNIVPCKRTKFIDNNINITTESNNQETNQDIKNNNQDISFFKFITEEGNKFENVIYQYLSSRYNTVQIVKTYQDVFKYSSVTNTIYNINIQTPIIFQALLSSDKLKYFGCIDFLIRSDIFKELISDTIPDYEIKTQNGKYLYEVVDAKHSTLKLASNGYNVLNSDRYPAYKGQLFIYLELLNEIQDSKNVQAYLLGKAYNYKQCKKTYKGEALFKKLGIVDFSAYDFEYKHKVNNAIKWIYDVKTKGQNWKLLPKPSKQELYPNMKNTGTKWDKFKNNYAMILGEITSIYYCGYKRRNNCHSNNVISWYSKNCNARAIGFKDNSIIGKHVDCILNINRCIDKLIDYGTLKDDKSWIPKKKTMDFFIDFETINSDYGQCNFYVNDDKQLVKKEIKNNNFTFMIGIGYQCTIENNWVYKCFYLPELDNNLELEMFLETEKYINSITKKYNCNKHRLIHWTNAEITFLNKFKSKWTPRPKLTLNFFDLYKTTYNNFVAVKGAFNYSLKSIGNAMNNVGLIDLSWDTDNCSNGLDCMLQAINLYNSKNVNEESFKHIIKYNEIDCKMMYLIFNNFVKHIKS